MNYIKRRTRKYLDYVIHRIAYESVQEVSYRLLSEIGIDTLEKLIAEKRENKVSYTTLSEILCKLHPTLKMDDNGKVIKVNDPVK